MDDHDERYLIIDFVASDERLGQGDVLYWQNSDNNFERAGVVVTADCDLVLDKHWGKVSVVPLITLECYIEDLLSPKLLAKREQELISHFKKKLVNALGKSATSSITHEAAELILNNYTLPEQFKTNDDLIFLHSVLRHIRKSDVYCSNKSLLELVEEFFRPSLSSEEVAEKFLKLIQNSLANLPGDLLLLSEIDGLPFKPALAWLRILREISEDNIALKRSEEKEGVAVRLGRLKPVFRHRLTQMLAHVFSDIGLPKAYEDIVAAGINDFTTGLCR